MKGNGFGSNGIRLKAFMLVACMLVCALTPMASLVVSDESFAESSGGDVQDDKFLYVSLGDSMSNGFGMSEYYPSEGNYNGFTQKVSGTFPYELNEYLYDIYEDDLEWRQLAISATRSAELRALLDDAFLGDMRTQKLFSGENSGLNDTMEALEKLGYEPSIDGMMAYFQDSVKAADLITYNYHYDFGYTLTDQIMGFIGAWGEAYPIDFTVYVEEEYLQMFDEVTTKVVNALMELLAEYDVDPSEELENNGIVITEELITFAKSMAKGIAYSVVSYCSNFDAIMEWIQTNNSDADVVVVDCYNTFGDMKMVYGDFMVPLGDIYGLILDIANTYTKYISPYASWTYHVDIDEIPTLFTDDFKNIVIDGEGTNLSDESKNVFMAAMDKSTNVVKENYYETYDGYDGKNYLLSKFLKYVFASNELDWGYFTGSDVKEEINGLETKVGTCIYLFSTQPDIEIVEDEFGTVTVGPVSFDKNELSMLWMNFFVLENSAVMSHPNKEGHAYIAAEVISTVKNIDDVKTEQDKIIEDVENIIDQIDIEELKAYLAAEIAKIKEKVEAYMAESDVDMDEIKAYVASEVAKLRAEIEACVDEAIAEIEAFIATELPALREKYQALAEKAIAEIEAYVKMVVAEIEAFVDHAIEEILAFFAPFHPTPVPPAAGDADSIGDIIVIGDELTGIGIGETYTSIIAKALGSELNEDWVIPGLRMDDIAYLIGATERCDGYTEMIVAGIMDETGKTVKEIQSAFASAIAQSDLVVVQAMANSFKFPIMQAGLLLEGEAALDFDINALEIVSDDMYAEMITVANKVDTFVYDLFGDDAEAMSTYGTVRSIMASTMYSALGYVESYAMVASALDVINPCAEAVFIGMWNPLSSFTYTDSNYGFVIDVGQIAGDIIWAVNGISALTVAPFGAHFIDISDAEIFADVYAATYGPNALEGIDFANEEELMLTLVKCMMTENGHQMVADRILAVAGDGHDVDLEYNITHHWMVCKDCGVTVGNPVTHTFDQEVVDEKYLKSDATADAPAIYYKSCICGVTSDVDTFEYGESTGGIQIDEEVINGGNLVKKTYPDGKVTYEWTHADGIVITGTVTASGAASFEVDVTVPAGVNDVDAIIGQALAALDEIAPAGDKTIVIDVAFPAADLDFEIGSEILAKIAAGKAVVNFNAGDFQMSFGHQVASTMAAKNGKVAITMGDADKTDLNDAQKAKAGDRRVIMLDADVGGQKIHDLGGTATLWFKHQNTGASPVVYHLDDEGELDSRSTTYSSGKVKFTSPTFSYYMVGTAADAGSGSGDDEDGGDDNTMLIIGAVVAVIAVIAVAAFLYLRKN